MVAQLDSNQRPSVPETEVLSVSSYRIMYPINKQIPQPAEAICNTELGDGYYLVAAVFFVVAFFAVLLRAVFLGASSPAGMGWSFRA